MQCRNAAKYPFNFRPLVCAAFGLGAGVAIGMHISGARALLAALLLLIAAYIMHAKKQRAATVMLVCAAAGLLRVAGYAFLPRDEVGEIIKNARFSRNHTPTALMPTVESLYARCDALFNEASPLARAILLGDRSTLGYFQRYAFRASGVSHTLALSGLHVSALTLVLLRCIPPNRPRVRAAFVFAFLGIYCAVAGFPASLMRAAIMFMCIVLAPLCLRRNDTASALSLAFIIIVCAEPLSIYSPPAPRACARRHYRCRNARHAAVHGDVLRRIQHVFNNCKHIHCAAYNACAADRAYRARTFIHIGAARRAFGNTRAADAGRERKHRCGHCFASVCADKAELL